MKLLAKFVLSFWLWLPGSYAGHRPFCFTVQYHIPYTIYLGTQEICVQNVNICWPQAILFYRIVPYTICHIPRETRNMCPKCQLSSVQNLQFRPKFRPTFEFSSKFSPAFERYLICKRTNTGVYCVKKCSSSLYYGRLVSLKSQSAGT